MLETEQRGAEAAGPDFLAPRSRNRKEIVPFFKYIKLLVYGARKLPSPCPIKVWRDAGVA